MSKPASDPTRPTCINPGCSEPVVYSHRSSTGTPRYRIHCSHCQRASYRRHPHRPGVTPYKTGRCVNLDGRLGFACPTRFELLPTWATGTTEVDHIDGNRNNNDPGNLQELCPLCHQLKGQQNRDFARRLTQSKTPVTIGISKQEQSKVKDSRDEHSSNIQLPAIFPHKKLQYDNNNNNKKEQQ